MIFNPTPVDGLKKYIHEAYKDDPELLEKYHIDKYSLEDAVDMTLWMIEDTATGVEMSNFGVCLNDGTAIGYMCCFKNNFYSFGINIHYRTKEVLKDFWSHVESIMNEGFITMLYPNNTRAINWLKRCGMVEIDGVDENCVTLLKI